MLFDIFGTSDQISGARNDVVDGIDLQQTSSSSQKKKAALSKVFFVLVLLVKWPNELPKNRKKKWLIPLGFTPLLKRFVALFKLMFKAPGGAGQPMAGWESAINEALMGKT